MKKILLTIYIFFSFVISVPAQIGVNTDSPSSLLEVVSKTSSSSGKVFIATNTDNVETLQIRNDGYIGVGVPNPLVKLDLRSTSPTTENALGIGNTSQTAVNAGAGAIRYNETEQALEYSDGTAWFRLQSNPDKVMVIAQNSSGQTYAPTSGTSLSANFANWTTIYDRTSNFNATTGYFTAPHDGIYSASVTGVFANANINSGGQYELQLVSSATGGYLKSTIPYLSVVSGMNVTNVCKSLFYLTTGQTIRVIAYFSGLPGSITLSSDPSLNVLTIAEM